MKKYELEDFGKKLAVPSDDFKPLWVLDNDIIRWYQGDNFSDETFWVNTMTGGVEAGRVHWIDGITHIRLLKVHPRYEQLQRLQNCVKASLDNDAKLAKNDEPSYNEEWLIKKLIDDYGYNAKDLELIAPDPLDKEKVLIEDIMAAAGFLSSWIHERSMLSEHEYDDVIRDIMKVINDYGKD